MCTYVRTYGHCPLRAMCFRGCASFLYTCDTFGYDTYEYQFLLTFCYEMQLCVLGQRTKQSV